MEKYNPKAIEALRYMVNAMTGLSLTENDVFRELEAMQERYGPVGPGPGSPCSIPLADAEDCMAATGNEGKGWDDMSEATFATNMSWRALYSDYAAKTGLRLRPLTHDEALTRLHTMRPADPAFTRTYLGDAS